MNRHRLSAAALFLVCSSLPAQPGDYWEIQEHSSNLRSGPGTEHGVLTQRNRGAVVMELLRQDGWMEVAINGEGRRAWIHRDLLQRLTAPPDEAPQSPDFNNFAALFDPASPANPFGPPAYFRAPVHLGFGVLQVDAHNGFLDLPAGARTEYLDSLLRLWATADNSGVPATVVVRNPDTGAHAYIHSAYRGEHVLTDAAAEER